ncbi:M56 family metallopeptidase [Paenibacillus sp. KN14-4R]|uniref:M56 family metallopeptidase n=1 Tax=Paenibacillus sp. KN14-4R TaxID=3445773 RepID=UPI003F9F1806
MDTLVEIFKWFIESTLAVSAVILLVLVIQKLFKRHISARLQHALWMIVLIRLLLPVFPDSSVSLFNVMHLSSSGQQMNSTLFSTIKHEKQISAEPAHIEQPYDPHTSETNSSLHSEIQSPSSEVIATTTNMSNWAVNLLPLSLQIVSILWASGTVLFLLYLLYFMFRMHTMRSSLQLVTDARLFTIMNDCRSQFGIRKSIPIYTGHHRHSPYISGIFKPWIYIPTSMIDEMSNSQLSHILSHELAHYKRRDMLWNMLASIAVSLHWINPLVWIAVKKMKSDRELACDAYVLEKLGEDESSSYGMTLLACIRYYSSTSRQPNLLYFKGLNPNHHTVRRIHMIQSFKKGSYKLSVFALLTVMLFAMITLTNAIQPAQAKAQDRMLFDSSFLFYNNLEKAVKMADFTFKVPSELPAGFQFGSISFEPNLKPNDKRTKVTIDFVQYTDRTHTGMFQLTADSQGKGLEASYEELSAKEKQRDMKVQRETIKLDKVEALKLTISSEYFHYYSYIWQDQNVQYQITYAYPLTDRQLEQIISSMHVPDQTMLKSYVNLDLLNAPIFDTDDARKAANTIGFQPKFPLQLGSFHATSADVTHKINFSHPDDNVDYFTKLLSILFTQERTDKSNKNQFEFKQIQNKNLYETIRMNGTVSYTRIDNKPNPVAVSPATIAGQEILVTAPYTLDGPLSTESATKYVSYFWVQSGICFQATFHTTASDQQAIVSMLINAPFTDMNNL